VKGRIHWYYDSLTPRLLALPLAVDAGVEELLEEVAESMQEYARLHASWEDRTGEAREGLTAEVIDEGVFKNSIVLYHTVDYGIWLEIRWNGKYAIILPTIEHYGPLAMASLGSTFDRIP
jgi:hypothetical protein